MKNAMHPMRLRLTEMTAGACLVATMMLNIPPAQAAVPGIVGTGTGGAVTFNLQAHDGVTSQPDGAQIYSWGYGCDKSVSPATGYKPFNGTCGDMQMPGPTLIVKQGDVVTVNLKNALPPAAGNTSIVFSGFDVTASGGVAGPVVKEAANSLGHPNVAGNLVTYTFTAVKPGTYSYHSGSQPELQVEMGMYGAIIVVPNIAAGSVTATACGGTAPRTPMALAVAAYDHPQTCYDREYLFQFSELSSDIHSQVQAEVNDCGPSPISACREIVAKFEPYRPNYYLVNGRSMPDLMDASYSPSYPNQPYNGNPHIKPGELMLMRIIGQGRWQHPFHYHANHARVIARDANLLKAETHPNQKLAGPLLFTTATVSGQTQDQIFAWTGKNLGWDIYGHASADAAPCIADDEGYYTKDGNGGPLPKDTPNYGEWCQDHGKGIPASPPDPNITALGQWYSGSPFLGLNHVDGSPNTAEPPGTLNQNPTNGYAYMWHSHNEREITTNDVFPGGMMMMLIIDPPAASIDEKM